ncbi:MAG: DUF5615 family PIN-like protein [Polyangiaceae bacterium]|nr:DUF5615 family PIN-like protein [Polyangiaceae bacterium]MCL4756673.1 DUF5615 family PIN-like protein [Myxococcales bacterium]
MMRFAVDEDFDNDIVRGLRRRLPGVDLIRVQDAGLRGADDPAVLAWAADNARILLTHDVSTMVHHALDRVRLGRRMPGLLAVHQQLSIGAVIDDLVLIATLGDGAEWENQVRYLPLR